MDTVALYRPQPLANGLYGWRAWSHSKDGSALPVTRVATGLLGTTVGVAICVAVVYGLILRRFTNAFAPFIDSLVLTLSVVAQLLLMTRR